MVELKTKHSPPSGNLARWCSMPLCIPMTSIQTWRAIDEEGVEHEFLVLIRRLQRGAAYLLLVIAALGLPIPPVPSRSGKEASDRLLRDFEQAIHAWWEFDAWPYSAGSSFYLGLAVALLLASSRRLRSQPAFRRNIVIAYLSFSVAMIGFLGPELLGVSPSNYDRSPDIYSGNPWGVAAVLLVILGICTLACWLQLVFKSRRARRPRPPRKVHRISGGDQRGA